jgi:hypothetical protein
MYHGSHHSRFSYTLGDLKDWLGKKDVMKGKKPAATSLSAGKKEKRKKGQENAF